MKKVVNTIVRQPGSLGCIYVTPFFALGFVSKKDLPNSSPLVNIIVCKGDVIIAVNEQSTHLTSIKVMLWQ